MDKYEHSTNNTRQQIPVQNSARHGPTKHRDKLKKYKHCQEATWNLWNIIRFLRSKKYLRIDTSKILSSRTSVCVACTVSTEDSLLFVKKNYCLSYRATRFLPKKRRESTRFNPR